MGTLGGRPRGFFDTVAGKGALMVVLQLGLGVSLHMYGFRVGFWVGFGHFEGLGVLLGLQVGGLVGGLVPQVGLKVGGGQVGG